VELGTRAQFGQYVPSSHNVIVYAINGALLIGAKRAKLAKNSLAILGAGEQVKIASADAHARFLLIAGKRLGEPVARGGPFVMNTKGEVKQAFLDGHDIHAMTASEMFGVPIEGMDPSIRRQAKAINFGVIYGISGFGLARNLRIPRKEAQGFIDRYFERFPGIREYMDVTVEAAKAKGYVETLFGRRIHTPNIAAKGPHAGFAKRAAINAPIQGTAADIIRRAMIRMPDAISGLPAKMLLQVHDELIFEVQADAVEDTIDAVRRIMENAAEPAVKINVPLVVDAGQGMNWAEAH